MVRLEGQLVERDAIRFTPAGVPVLECRLLHRSVQDEAGLPREVEFEIAAVALGDVVSSLDRLVAGTRLVASGFLAPGRKAARSLRLHIQAFEPIIA
jgi:primosomal replication protein N